ncbi:MAG: serine/threonine-protein kinase [Acidobacteriota bacterium]
MSTLERNRRALVLLHEVLTEEPASRRALVERRCAGDGVLKAELLELLAEASAAHDGFLERPVPEALGHEADATASPPPDTIGAYRVTERLGEGGMGTVWLGVQDLPVRRRVALKLIRRVHGPSGRHRFAVECQALAKLSHPNIAALYEVGQTADGRPFLAMELIEGQKISEYCRQHQLPLRERLRLFLGVCAAVRHAHEKGILHRDIKPSNVLVTEVDEQPLAKVIDFGIARILDDPILSSPSAPQDQAIVGSPAYMSPEAAGGDSAVDTRSDVYSLGLLLYELLIEALPFEVETQTILQLRQSACRRLDLPKPSERYAALEPGARTRIAERRGLGEKDLLRRLRGDLDAIVQRAISFDPADRYSSPSDLAADLERYLEIRPVSARRMTWSYALSRLVRRRFAAAAAAAAVVLALGGGALVSSMEARRAHLEVERSRLFSSFLVELFALSDPDRDPSRENTSRELLDRGASVLAEELVGQPLDRARLAHAISEVYLRLGLHQRAESLAEVALELRQTELARNDEELLQSLAQLGVIYRHQRRFEESAPLLEEVFAVRQAQSLRRPLALAAALNDLGNLAWARDEEPEALAHHMEALEIRQRELGPNDEMLARSLNNVGALAVELGRHEEAVGYLRRADAIFVRIFGENHPVRAAPLNNLGMSEIRTGQWAQAEESLRQALAIWRVSHGETHQRTLNAKSNLSRLLGVSGRWVELVETLEDLVPILEAQPRPHISLAYNLMRLGLAKRNLGDSEQAYAAFDKAVDLSLTHWGEESSGAIRSRLHRARAAADLGRFEAAESEARDTLERVMSLETQSLSLEAFARRTLGTILVDLGRLSEAETQLQRALEADALTSGYLSNRGPATRALGELELKRGRAENARRYFQRAATIYREEYPPGHPALNSLRDRLEAAAQAL